MTCAVLITPLVDVVPKIENCDYIGVDAGALKIIDQGFPIKMAVGDFDSLSEEDFKLRGHGDLFGTRQSGDMSFKIANVKEDYKILLQTKKDSMEFLKSTKEEDIKLRCEIISSINDA